MLDSDDQLVEQWLLTSNIQFENRGQWNVIFTDVLIAGRDLEKRVNGWAHGPSLTYQTTIFYFIIWCKYKSEGGQI